MPCVNWLMNKPGNYDDIFSLFSWEFSHAVKSLNFDASQAFAYACDEQESILRNPNPWIRVAAYTALFKCAHKYGVAFGTFKQDDPFSTDLIDELSVVFSTADHLLATEEIPIEFMNLQKDLVFVREKYENWIKNYRALNQTAAHKEI